MKSIITLKEENKFYLRTNLLLPVYIGLIFTVIILIIYNLLYVIFNDNGFNWNWTFVVIAFILGFLEGLSTIYLMARQNKKDFKYYTNLNKKTKTDFFVPVTLLEGFLKNSRGILLVTKDKVEVKINQLFDKRTHFSKSFQDVQLEVVYEKNSLLKKILTFTKGTNILYVTCNKKKLSFIIPSTINITHRLETHPILGRKKG